MKALQLLVLVSFAVMFIGKLGDVGNIGTWSWWWVTSPLWGSTVLYYALFGLGFLLALIKKEP